MKKILLCTMAMLLAASVASADDTKKKKSAVKIGGISVEAESEGDDEGSAKVEVSDSKGVAAQVSADVEGKRLTIDGLGKKLSHACAEEKGSEVFISGSNHKITLSGECAIVNVSGTNNVVTIDAAAWITVSGVGNQLSYLRGIGGKPPKIDNSGVNNGVKKIEKK